MPPQLLVGSAAAATLAPLEDPHLAPVGGFLVVDLRSEGLLRRELLPQIIDAAPWAPVIILVPAHHRLLQQACPILLTQSPHVQPVVAPPPASSDHHLYMGPRHASRSPSSTHHDAGRLDRTPAQGEPARVGARGRPHAPAGRRSPSGRQAHSASAPHARPADPVPLAPGRGSRHLRTTNGHRRCDGGGLGYATPRLPPVGPAAARGYAKGARSIAGLGSGARAGTAARITPDRGVGSSEREAPTRREARH